MNQEAASITELNAYIKMLLDNDEVLQNIHAIGEISNFKKHSSGHLYFSLKDEKCSIKCMMFSHYTSNINFNLENGIKVFAYGNISCYEPMGQYQIYIYYLAPAGLGEINESLKKLYKKLESEGLFDESRKKKLKKFPRKIGVITSKTGAVIHDISSVLKRRFPIAEIVLASVRVQGSEAVQEILNAINLTEKIPELDVIIIARGGGSLEDLWAFNNEKVVRRISNCKIPVISAVGHDVDYTLCDYAADVRASTPSVAAELASESIENIFLIINNFKQKFKNILENKILNLSSEIKFLKQKININFSNLINKKISDLNLLKNKLEIFNPENIFTKGFVIIKINNKIIKNIDNITENSQAKIIFLDGIAEFNICNLKTKKTKNKIQKIGNKNEEKKI